VWRERDSLKVQISYLKNPTDSSNKNVKLDVLLDNKVTKLKLLEAKEDYGKILHENIQYKDRWEKEK